MAGRVKRLGILLLILVALYLLSGAVFLRFFVERIAVAKATWTPEMLSKPSTSFPLVNGRSLSARVVGRMRHRGCVAIFPGRHGPTAAYEEAVVPLLVNRDLRVYLIAYPGQLGSVSGASLGEIPLLASVAVEQIAMDCRLPNLVLVGRSLGSMVAVYAARHGRVTGLVLESTAPRFSTFLRSNLRARWYVWPMLLLPTQRLLSEDYSLNSALSDVHRPVAIFQGTKDEVTPIADLATEPLPENVKLISVEDATHSNVYSLALPQYVETIAGMLK